MHSREDQISKYHPDSEFQFFDITEIEKMIKFAVEREITSLNVASEPISVREIVNVFGKHSLKGEQILKYDFRSKHAPKDGYFYTKDWILSRIKELTNEA
jgi:hypothetical protein